MKGRRPRPALRPRERGRPHNTRLVPRGASGAVSRVSLMLCICWLLFNYSDIFMQYKKSWETTNECQKRTDRPPEDTGRWGSFRRTPRRGPGLRLWQACAPGRKTSFLQPVFPSDL